MTNIVTITVSSRDAFGSPPVRKFKTLNFEAKGEFATSQVRAVLRNLKKIAPDYVKIQVENDQEITEIK